MRSISTVLVVTGLLLAACGSAFSQGGGVGSAGTGAVSMVASSVNGGGSCAGYGSSMNGNGGSFVYTFRFGSCFAVEVLTGAPYSGHGTAETVRTLQDGTHLTQPSMAQPMIYRDSMGRTRTERSPAGPMLAPGGTARPSQPVVPEINDPVAGYHYVLDSVNHVAHRVKVLPRNMQPPPAAMIPPSRTLPNGMTLTTESLGTQTMFGLTVNGTRQTTTYPPGTYQGNDRVVTSVSESWRSPQYGLVLLSKNTGMNGDSTTSFKDLSLAEPDPTLFQIPAGYQIVDEPGEFTFTIQQPAQ